MPAPHEELEGGGTWSSEPINLNHVRRFASAAFTKRLRFAVTYPTKTTARIHAPSSEALEVSVLITETEK